MTENKIIITWPIIAKTNMIICVMDEVLDELKENFKILLELVEKYGCRRNYKEIKKMLEKANILFLIQDIFQIKTYEAMDKHEIKGTK